MWAAVEGTPGTSRGVLQRLILSTTWSASISFTVSATSPIFDPTLASHSGSFMYFIRAGMPPDWMSSNIGLRSGSFCCCCVEVFLGEVDDDDDDKVWER